ncbi:hypothetical protein GCM10009016_11890 [Halomonas beimenensis]
MFSLCPSLLGQLIFQLDNEAMGLIIFAQPLMRGVGGGPSENDIALEHRSRVSYPRDGKQADNQSRLEYASSLASTYRHHPPFPRVS